MYIAIRRMRYLIYCVKLVVVDYNDLDNQLFKIIIKIKWLRIDIKIHNTLKNLIFSNNCPTYWLNKQLENLT